MAHFNSARDRRLLKNSESFYLGASEEVMQRTSGDGEPQHLFMSRLKHVEDSLNQVQLFVTSVWENGRHRY